MRNLVPYNYQVQREQRNEVYGHNSFVVWFTGFSGSGKSTIANLVEKKLFEQGVKTYSLDADDVRGGVNKDLTFEPCDRTENVRRISEISALMVDAGIVVLAAFVSPYKKDRENIKKIVKECNFVEVFVDTSIEVCEERDVKGLYKKAREGKIKNLTGISAPYERPENPDILIETEKVSIEDAVNKVIDYISPKLEINNE